MRASLRFATPLFLAALCAATALVWVRSYWRVDKAWLQILPNYSADLQITPGQITLGGAPSAVRLPVAEGDWFSWPVDAYFAEYIPPPTNTLVGEFGFYNGRVSLPLWFVLLGAMSLNMAALAPALLRQFAAARSTRPRVFPLDLQPSFPTGTLLRRDDPMVAVTPLHMEPTITTPAFEAASAFEGANPMTAVAPDPAAPQAAELLHAVS